MSKEHAFITTLKDLWFVHQDFYPINYLRNVALNAAHTDYVFLSDVDFLPMPGLHNKLLSNILKQGRQTRQVSLV